MDSEKVSHFQDKGEKMWNVLFDIKKRLAKFCLFFQIISDTKIQVVHHSHHLQNSEMILR